jgi:cytochrome-b5 reductase
MLVLRHIRRRILPFTLPLVLNMNCCTNAIDASNSKECALPSTLTSAPVKSIIAPGECQFGDNFTAVPLLENLPVSSTSFVLRFGLPEKSKGLGLSTCACLLAGAKVDGEEMVIRPYTPISTNEDKGSFDLLIKVI